MGKIYYTIGEVSKIKGITIKALRFYDRIGLLKPHHVDPANQYRYYTIEQLIYIDIIKAARSMNISPKDLIPYFIDKDTHGLINLLSQQKTKTRQLIHTLEETVNAIENLENAIHISETVKDLDDIYKKRLPNRHILTIPFNRDKTIEEYIIDYSNLDILLNQRGLLNKYETGILFIQAEDGNFLPGYLFVSISSAVNEDDYRMIPGGEYICVRYTQQNAQSQMEKLTQYFFQQDQNPLDLVQVELLVDLFSFETAFFELEARISD